MVFTVPEDFKGSFVLSTLNKALWSGMVVSIHGPNLYAPDVKMAIKQGRLVPLGEEYDEEQANLSHEAMIVNRTDKVLVLGKIILKPWATQMIDKHIAMSANIKSAEKNGFVHIVSDETSYDEKKPKKIKVGSIKKKKTPTKKEVEAEDETFKYSIPEIGADREVKAKVWNFRDQESLEAEVVPSAPDMVNVDEEETEEVEFVDDPVVVQQVASKKKEKKIKKKVKKATMKKAVKKTIKKKGKATKKKKVKSIEPVGDNTNVAIELNSNGRPLSADETLQHLIDSLAKPEDISFVDNEQAQEKYEQRTDMD